MSGVFDITGNEIVSDSSGFGADMQKVNALVSVNTGRIASLESLHSEFGLPVLKLYGDTSKMTKEKAVNLDAEYFDGVRTFKCIAKTKWQGESTLTYDKKNYNIRLQDGEKNKVLVSFKDWLPTNKYHIKANYSEPSLVRNSVGSQLGRKAFPNLYPNYARGEIDSFPFILYINDEWYGCYTWNLTQDGDLFAMDEDNKNHMVFRCNALSDSAGWDMSGFEDRLRDESTEYSLQQLQRMVSWTKTCTNAEFYDSAKDYFNLDSLMYYWLTADIECATDNICNNTTWASWDGTHWYAMWYDTDLIFGMSSKLAFSPTLDLIAETKKSQFAYKYNPIWDKLYASFYTQLCEKYAELRENLFTDAQTIVGYFTSYRNKWGAENLALENQKWPPLNPQRAIELCESDISSRLTYCDNKYGYTGGTT